MSKLYLSLLAMALLVADAGAQDGSLLGSVRFPASSPHVVLTMGAILLGGLLLVVVLELARQWSALRQRQQSQWKHFENLSREMRLEPAQESLLREFHAALDSYHPPDVLLRIPAVYDRALDVWLARDGRERTLSDAQWDELSALRRRIGFHVLPPETSLSHTRQLTVGQDLRLLPEGARRTWPATVTKCSENHLEIRAVEPIELSENANLQLVFSRRSDGEYSATVAVISSSAEGVLTLRHASELRRQQLRMWVRVAVQIDAKMRELVDADDNPLPIRSLDARLLDLSGGGAMVALAANLPLETRGLMDFWLGDVEVQGVRFVLLREGRPRRDHPNVAHLCFVNIEIPAQERIMRFVFERQRLGRAKV